MTRFLYSHLYALHCTALQATLLGLGCAWEDASRLIREFGDGAGLDEWGFVFFAAGAAQDFVGLHAGAHEGAKGAMCGERVGGAEGQASVDKSLAGGAPGVLRRKDEAGHGLVGALVLGPLPVGVFDGHGVEVGAELDGDLPLGGLGPEKGDGGGAEAVVVLGLEVLTEQGFELRGVGDEAELGNVVAVADRGLTVEGLRQRVIEGVAEEVESRAFVAEHGVGGERDSGNGALEGLRHMRRDVFDRGNLGEEGFGADGVEDLTGVEDKVLSELPGVAGEHFALNADDLEGKAAGAGDFAVVVVVAGHVGEARDDRVGARGGEEALAQVRGQVGVDAELAAQEAVGLGVGAADGMAEALAGELVGFAHGSDDGVDGLLLVGVDVLDAGGVADVGAGGCVGGGGRHGFLHGVA